jgi:single-strand DNA-binding protein
MFMATLNKVTLIGYLGRDPESRATAAGDAVVQLSLATTETWKDKNTGEKKEATEWHRVVLYRKLAEIAGLYLKKGSHVYIEGRLQSRKWTGKDDIERTMVEIIADDLRMLGNKSVNLQEPDGHGREDTAAAPAQKTARRPVQYEYEDDAIPF